MTTAALLAALREIADEDRSQGWTAIKLRDIARRAIHEHAEVDSLSEPLVVTITLDDAGRCVAVTRTNSEGQIESVIWEAPTREPESGADGPSSVFLIVDKDGRAELESDHYKTGRVGANVDARIYSDSYPDKAPHIAVEYIRAAPPERESEITCPCCGSPDITPDRFASLGLKCDVCRCRWSQDWRKS